MKNEILKNALTIEQLEDRFEMTTGALDGCRCVLGDCNDGGGAEVAPQTIEIGDGGSENP